jgi:hypothetical protein
MLCLITKTFLLCEIEKTLINLKKKAADVWLEAMHRECERMMIWEKYWSHDK